MRDIQKVLERWGGWAAAEGTQLDWSPVAAGFKGLLPDERRSRLSCCDNDGTIVDSAIAKLNKVGRSEEVELIMLHYFYNLSKSAIARKKKCSEGKIRNQLMIAETFIDACIIMSDAELEMDAWV
ncbi:antiterminator Q family protein [Pantoea sp. MBD-2R]|uniref:antiterminator Q family protein n=1 Tax=unclassified Pantoea TaxID=2630326 RepID=UPI0011BF0635|nr:antiterminator Q family protein [Pantoea sp. CCBC3-3-1]